MSRAFISVEFNCTNRGRLTEYGGVRVSIRHEGKERAQKKVFDTGEYARDYINAILWLMSLDDCEGVCMSSSVDDFTSDVNGYAWQKNEIVGEFPVPTKNHGDAWFKTEVAVGNHKGKTMWIENGGEKIVRHEGDNKYLWIAPGYNAIISSTSHKAALAHIVALKKKVVTTWE